MNIGDKHMWMVIKYFFFSMALWNTKEIFMLDSQGGQVGNVPDSHPRSPGSTPAHGILP